MARFSSILVLWCAWVVPAGAATREVPITSHRLAGRLQVRHLPDMDSDVLAGRYEVFEDRRAASGRKIPLDIVVLPARTATPAPEPLVFLAGGDLPPATQWAAFLEHAVDRLRDERDILLVDQRGTGESHRLDCQLPDPASEPGAADDFATWRAAMKRCRENLSRRADLRLYTTPLAMDDLFEVCEWLGWSRVDLWGVSYGTKAARVYARQHPGRVRTMVLFGVLPLAPSTWTDRAHAAQRGLDRVLTDCERDSSCDANFPDLDLEVDSLLARAARAPVPLRVATPAHADRVVNVDDRWVRDRIEAALSYAALRAELPYVLHAAYRGDWQPFARWIGPPAAATEEGAAACLACSEDFAQFDAKRAIASAATTFWGDAPLRRQLATCEEWPRGWLPRAYFEPVTARVPALFLAGEVDHIAPPEYAEKTAWHWSGGRVLVLPGHGHADLDACVLELVQEFVHSGGKAVLEPPCARQAPHFVTRAAELKPVARP